MVSHLIGQYGGCLVASWLTSAAIGYGFIVAALQRRYPELAHQDRFKDRAVAAAGVLVSGPASFLAILLVWGFPTGFRHGWRL